MWRDNLLKKTDTALMDSAGLWSPALVRLKLLLIDLQRSKGQYEMQQDLKYNLPLLDVFPVLSNEVPGQFVPHHILSYCTNNRGNIHQTYFLSIQTVLQISAR